MLPPVTRRPCHHATTGRRGDPRSPRSPLPGMGGRRGRVAQAARLATDPTISSESTAGFKRGLPRVPSSTRDTHANTRVRPR